MRRALVATATGWAAALPLAAYAASRPQGASWWYPLALSVYSLGAIVCHQRAERSFHLFAAQLPVCARCTGIYVGAAIGLLIVAAEWIGSERGSDRGLDAVRGSSYRRAVLLLAALPTLATLGFEWTTGLMPGNWIRASAGALLGAALAVTVLRSMPRAGGALR